MNELKTLKDLGYSKQEDGDVSKYDLKEEAIKHIKELKRYEYMEKDGYCLICNEWFDYFDKHNKCGKDNILNNYYESSDVEGAIKMLKHFFNITEGDFKE